MKKGPMLILTVIFLMFMVLLVGCQGTAIKRPANLVPLDVTVTAATPVAPSTSPVPPVETTLVPPTSPASPSQSCGQPKKCPEGSEPYLVKKGDTLMGIARTKYGDANLWQKIAAYNCLCGDRIFECQTLCIPPKHWVPSVCN